MAKKLIIIFIISLICTAIATYFIIKILKRKAKQPILKYVTEHFSKSGTPTMGGIGFILVSLLVFAFAQKKSLVLSTASALIYLTYGVIGFSDDLIKIKFAKNEGLTPWQKIFFQVIVALLASFFCGYHGLTKVYLPFSKRLVDLGYIYYPFSVFVFLATVNCVNLTDGLDGLAGTSGAAVLLAGAVMIVIQINRGSAYYPNKEEYEGLSLLAMSVAGSLFGYLLFNVNKASVFMGDTGSLSLGGIIACVYTFSGNALFIPIAGIVFVLSGISVIVQVLYYKKTKRRVFLMAPLHHHFQHKGYSESKITFWYGAISLVLGLVCILNFL